MATFPLHTHKCTTSLVHLVYISRVGLTLNHIYTVCVQYLCRVGRTMYIRCIHGILAWKSPNV